MIPLAIALAVANHLRAARVCYDQYTATTSLFILDKALGCFEDLKKKNIYIIHIQPTPPLSHVVLTRLATVN